MKSSVGDPGIPATDVIPRRLLGRTGIEVSAIGLGCVTFGREIDESAATAVLDRAIELGVNLVDTAESYGDGQSERILGRLLQRPGIRERLVVCSKAGGDLSRARLLRAANESLARLQLRTIDVYLLHNYDALHPLEETLGALNQLIEEGRVRFIGCSNFSSEQLARVSEIQAKRGWAQFSVVEMIYNLVVRKNERDLLPFCRHEGIGVLAHSPLGAGFLTGKYQPGHALPPGTRFDVRPDHRRVYFAPRSFSFLTTLKELAETAGVSPVCLALTWALTRPDVSAVLVGARNTEQVEQAWSAWCQRDKLGPILARLTAASQEFLNPPEATGST